MILFLKKANELKENYLKMLWLTFQIKKNAVVAEATKGIWFKGVATGVKRQGIETRYRKYIDFEIRGNTDILIVGNLRTHSKIYGMEHTQGPALCPVLCFTGPLPRTLQIFSVKIGERS